MTKKIFSTCVISIICVISTLFLNLIISNAIFSDDCEIGDTGMIFNLFYEISSNTGYHPEITIFNFTLTIIIGLLIASYLSQKLVWRRK
jgi:hypothetical protein